MTSLTPQTPDSQILLYQTEDGHTRIEVQFKGETVWFSLNQMADLFQRDKSVISKHIRNVFDEGELTPDSTVAKFATVQENEISEKIIGAAVEVHRILGPGLLESIYEEATWYRFEIGSIG